MCDKSSGACPAPSPSPPRAKLLAARHQQRQHTTHAGGELINPLLPLVSREVESETSPHIRLRPSRCQRRCESTGCCSNLQVALSALAKSAPGTTNPDTECHSRLPASRPRHPSRLAPRLSPCQLLPISKSPSPGHSRLSHSSAESKAESVTTPPPVCSTTLILTVFPAQRVPVPVQQSHRNRCLCSARPQAANWARHPSVKRRHSHSCSHQQMGPSRSPTGCYPIAERHSLATRNTDSWQWATATPRSSAPRSPNRLGTGWQTTGDMTFVITSSALTEDHCVAKASVKNPNQSSMVS